MIKLPVDEHLSEIGTALGESDVVILKAPPGTGKTTRVPAFLSFDLGLKTVVLEPRRIAARQSALRVCEERGALHGDVVGHAFRSEAKWGERTRLLFATEGTFLALLKNRAFDFDIVVIDEFHERHLDGDFSLAVLAAMGKKIVIMSATLEGLDLEGYFRSLGKCAQQIEVKAPLFNCEIKYLDNIPSILSQSLERKVLEAMSEALAFGGDILVFLPGIREIENVEAALIRASLDIKVVKLHGKLSVSEQAESFKAALQTKVILATNVAESSLTVPGVRVVIDSGLSKEMQWSAWSHLSTLKEIKIAQSNSIQRSGRAVREADGLCLRLFAKLDYDSRDKSVSPEIARTELESIRLRHLELGRPTLHWFEAPPEKSWSEALSNLEMMGAYDSVKDCLSSIGKKMSSISLSPSFARSLIELEGASERTRRDFIRFVSRKSQYTESQLKALVSKFAGAVGEREEPLGRILLPGFIRSIARARKLDIVSMNSSVLPISTHLANEIHEGEWGLVLDVDGRGRVQDFVGIDSDWIYELEPMPVWEKREVVLDEEKGLILSEKISVGALILEETSRNVTVDLLNGELKERALLLLAKKNEALLAKFQVGSKWQRICFLYEFKESASLLKRDVAEFCESGLEFSAEVFHSYLEMKVSEHWGLNIDQELPLRIGELEVFYDEVSGPYLMSFIQFFFGLKQTPVLPLTKSPLLLKLQGPHKRPVQVTSDLAGFWSRGYQELLKEMRREYPRHHWPDDPGSAPAILLKRQLSNS